MSQFLQKQSREDVSKRLRRIEGQLRGVIRMIEDESPCMDVAQQLSAARKALDSVFARMTVCYLEQELEPVSNQSGVDLERVMDDVSTLLKRMN